MRCQIAGRIVTVAGILLTPMWASAQGDAQDQQSHWGVMVSFAPRWQSPAAARIVFDASTIDVSGSDFTIGVIRGRQTSGDWGVSYVRKTIKDGSSVRRHLTEECRGSFGCVQSGTVLSAASARMEGLALHKYFSVATIRRRAQIGIDLAGGAARVKGNALRDEYFPEFATDPQRGFITGVTQGHTTATVNARELILEDTSVVPLLRTQIIVSALLSSDLKLRIGGGLDFPGYAPFDVSLSYLFGAR